MIVSEEQYLAHYGVKGMKWGVRKAIDKVGSKIKSNKQAKKEYNQKLKNIANRNKRKVILTNDDKRINYRSQSLVKRAGKMAATLAVQKVFSDVMTGKAAYYGNMSKADIARSIGKLATLTALNVKIKDSLADSSAKKYSQSGKRIEKEKLIEKEDMMEIGINTAVRAAPVAMFVASSKLSKVAAQKRKNREIFEKWGSNILSQRASDYNNVWTSDDGSTSILERVR